MIGGRLIATLCVRGDDGGEVKAGFGRDQRSVEDPPGQTVAEKCYAKGHGQGLLAPVHVDACADRDLVEEPGDRLQVGNVHTTV